MGDESTNSFQKKNSSTSQQTNQFGSRPFAAPVQMKSQEQQTPEELESEAFGQNKFEAFGLQLKEKSGTITPVEQERLGVLQAKMDDFWAQKKERASRSGFDFSKVSVTPSESAAPQLQPMGRLGTQGESMGGQRSHLNSPQQSLVSLIQAKLTIGEPGDKYEQEADRVASVVVQRINTPSSTGQSVQREAMPEEDELQMKPLADSIQRVEIDDEEELQMKSLADSIQRVEIDDEEELQMKSQVQRWEAIGGEEASTDLESDINSARGGGQAVADNIRKPMEQAFGTDFSGVKVHTDSQSDQLNRSIQARAFTTGQDVFFRQGEYNPGSRGGQELLAHELTHVVQQNGGAVMRKMKAQNEQTQVHHLAVRHKNITSTAPTLFKMQQPIALLSL